MRKGPPRPSKFDIPPELLLPPPAPPLDLCSPGILATLVQKERAKPRSYVPYTPLTVRVPDYLLAQQDQVDGADPGPRVQDLVDGVFEFMSVDLDDAAHELERNSSKAKQVALREQEQQARLSQCIALLRVSGADAFCKLGGASCVGARSRRRRRAGRRADGRNGPAARRTGDAAARMAARTSGAGGLKLIN